MSVSPVGRALPLCVLLIGLTAAWTQRTRVPLLRYLTVGSHRIPFESADGSAARFRFVDQTLGPARRPSAGVDARAMSACYRPIADPVVGSMSLLFESDEVGQPELLTQFELIPAGTRPEVERGCLRIHVASTAIATDRGIRLGLTRAAVLRLLGAPERDHDGVAEFASLGERVVRTGGSVDRFDLFSTLTVTFRNGRVVAFSGAVGETN